MRSGWESYEDVVAGIPHVGLTASNPQSIRSSMSQRSHKWMKVDTYPASVRWKDEVACQSFRIQNPDSRLQRQCFKGPYPRRLTTTTLKHHAHEAHNGGNGSHARRDCELHRLPAMV